MDFLRLMFMLQDKEGGFMGGAGGGSEDPPKDDPPSDDPPKDDPPSDEPDLKWPEGLEDDYKGRGDLKRFANEDGSFNVAKLMKSFVHANQNISADKIAIPTKHATDEQWRETYEKLGLPKEIDGYDVKNQVAEGLEADEEFFEGFKKIAHEAGVLPKQAQKLVDYYNETMANSIKADIKAQKDALDSGIQELKEEWGDGFARKISEGEQAFKHFATDADIEALKNTGIFNNPAFSRVFSKIADAMNQEDTFDSKAAGKLNMTLDEINQEINDLRNSEQYKDRMHPQHMTARKNMEKLYNRRARAKSNIG